jgi:hypothetical protein
VEDLAHSMLVMMYHLLHDGAPYQELGDGCVEKLQRNGCRITVAPIDLRRAQDLLSSKGRSIRSFVNRLLPSSNWFEMFLIQLAEMQVG